jgi:hypothetical protein
MKKVILIVAVLISCTCYSQDFLNNTFIFTLDVNIKSFDYKENKILDDTYTAKRGQKIVIKMHYVKPTDSEDINGYVFTFLPFKTPDKDDADKVSKIQTLSDQKIPTYLINDKYFFVSEKDFLKGTTKEFPAKHSAISFNALVLPVKMRFGNKEERYFDFGKDITLSPSIGYKRHLGKDPFKERFLNIMVGFGITSVSIDSADAPGLLADGSSANFTAITPSIGIMYEINKLQFGVFLGWDYLSRKGSRTWIYQGLPWLSIGLGLQIFNDKGGNGGTNSNEKQKNPN